MPVFTLKANRTSSCNDEILVPLRSCSVSFVGEERLRDKMSLQFLRLLPLLEKRFAMQCDLLINESPWGNRLVTS